jgi:ribonuclease HI
MRILSPDPGLLIVSCDGAARGNPGPAGIGVQITDEDGNVLAEIAEWLGETTNNVAEYTAALEGLRKAGDLGARRVHLRSDSKLLIEQLAGRYKVKASHLRPLHAEVLGLMAGFERVRLQHVPREQNREADRLANLGVDLRGPGSATR